MNLLLLGLVFVALVVVVALLLRPGGLWAQPRMVSRAPQPSSRIQELRRSLMSKAMGDASKVNSWVEYERSKAPLLSEEECYLRANERWERDNR